MPNSYDKFFSCATCPAQVVTTDTGHIMSALRKKTKGLISFQPDMDKELGLFLALTTFNPAAVRWMVILTPLTTRSSLYTCAISYFQSIDALLFFDCPLRYEGTRIESIFLLEKCEKISIMNLSNCTLVK